MGEDGLFLSINMRYFLKMFKIREIHKAVNIAVIFMILECWAGQKFAYSSDIFYLRVPMGIDKNRVADAAELVISNADLNMHRARLLEGIRQTEQSLIAQLVDILSPVSDSQMNEQELQLVFSEAEGKIFEKIIRIKQLRSELALLDNSADTYLGLNGTESPDCGLCFRLVNVLAEALKKTRRLFAIQDIRHHETGQIVHKFIYIFSGDKIIAIDMAAGQYLPLWRGHIAISEINEHLRQLSESFSLWWSDEENTKRLVV